MTSWSAWLYDWWKAKHNDTMKTSTNVETIEHLVQRMTLAEKAGALLAARIMLNPDGSVWEGREDQSPWGFTPTRELIVERMIGHVGLMNTPSVRALAQWNVALQDLAAQTRLGIPVSVGADPTHGRARNAQVSQSGAGFSEITEPIGLAATADPDLVEDTARMMARELRAVGIHIAVHPMADLATEPRWARVSGTFGESPELAAEMTAAFVRGLQSGGAQDRVLATAKHFPGGGPQRDGWDSHFEKGSNTVYPGGRFDGHLEPFAAAIREGVAMMMPGYAAPVGTGFEEVGFAFQHGIITELLREQMGFDGVVVTDFNIVTGMRVPKLGLELPVRAWGMLDVPPVERVGMLFAAGVDQLGGEDDPSLILQAVERGLVTEERLDLSVARVLRDKQRLGLLDGLLGEPAEDSNENISVSGLIGGVLPAEQIGQVVATAENLALARKVQAASVIALAGAPLQLPARPKLYVEGIDPEVAARFGEVVEDPRLADAAILRIDAPYDVLPPGSMEAHFHQGTLEFSADTIVHITEIASIVPTVLDVFLERAAVLTPFTELPLAALFGTFGVSDEVLLDAATGAANVSGKLPFDIPRSDAAVRAAREDVPFDTEDPVYRFGHGLSW
ncbi:glycoside hydrolase family 3 N-terminal domain-containing protein [Glutamicibacter ectropisis]|uniref:beta-glucosidase n=1 Tax=Glutamicibacter ectropisis TaxID=3046593 RepID=A0AAU6WBQ4_9MICC